MVEVVVVRVEDLHHFLVWLLMMVVQVVVDLVGELKLVLEEAVTTLHSLLHRATMVELVHLMVLETIELPVVEVDLLLLAHLEYHFLTLMSVLLVVLELL
jgi:hypothetical protein|tara:strand:+ start:265 stop:564 length:300 start_codon:yes stop_codon:yes gene_type:complete